MYCGLQKSRFWPQPLWSCPPRAGHLPLGAQMHLRTISAGFPFSAPQSSLLCLLRKPLSSEISSTLYSLKILSALILTLPNISKHCHQLESFFFFISTIVLFKLPSSWKFSEQLCYPWNEAQTPWLGKQILFSRTFCHHTSVWFHFSIIHSAFQGHYDLYIFTYLVFYGYCFYHLLPHLSYKPTSIYL